MFGRQFTFVQLVFLFACVLLLPAPAGAILIETAPKKRVGGYLVKEDVKQITVRYKTTDGAEKTEAFDRAKIKIVHQIDRERLEMLTKSNSQAYRDYAEELAEKNADPEAIEFALQLFLIAAYLDPQKHGGSCLLRMSALAPQPADARRYRAMAFLLDRNADASILKDEAAPKKALGKDLQYFQRALKQFRNGQYIEAQANAQVPGVASYFNAVPGMLDQKSFIQACKDAIASKSTADDHLEAVLRAEIWVLEQQLGSAPAGKQSVPAGWARALSSADLTPIPPFSLETISPYDPRKCVYRKGAWVAP